MSKVCIQLCNAGQQLHRLTRISEKIFKAKRERLKVTVSQWRKLSALIPSCQSKPLWLLWLSITFTPICPIPTLHTCTWPLMCFLLIFGSITPTQITFPKNSFITHPPCPTHFCQCFFFTLNFANYLYCYLKEKISLTTGTNILQITFTPTCFKVSLDIDMIYLIRCRQLKSSV